MRRCAARQSDGPSRGRRATPAPPRCGGGGVTLFPPHAPLATETWLYAPPCSLAAMKPACVPGVSASPSAPPPEGQGVARTCLEFSIYVANLTKMTVAERREAEPTTQQRNEVGLAVRQATIVLLAGSCCQYACKAINASCRSHAEAMQPTMRFPEIFGPLAWA